MRHDRIRWRMLLFDITIIIAALGIPAFSVFPGPSKAVDDLEVIGGETWRVWTAFNDFDEDIMYSRTIDGIETPPSLVHSVNLTPDYDAAISGCDACPKPNERIWVAWERYDDDNLEDVVGSDLDIILATRAPGTAWGSEILPHYDNDYDDFNPDILGDGDGHVWIVWVVKYVYKPSHETEYQLRYTFYDGISGDDSGWEDDVIIHIGDLYDGSNPKLVEDERLGVVKAQWKDIDNQVFEQILPKPRKK